MIRINLLPHRAEFRKQQIIEYITVFVASVLLAVALIVVVDIWSTQDLTDLQEEQATLKEKNAILSKKIGELRNLDALRKEVEGKLQIVDELQAGRFRSLTTFNAIVQAMPQNVWLMKVSDTGNAVKLAGYGESSQAVANFMRSLQNSKLFENIQLVFDKQATVENASVRQFDLTFRRLTLAEQESKVAVESAGGAR